MEICPEGRQKRRRGIHEAILVEARLSLPKDFTPIYFSFVKQKHNGRYESLVPGPVFLSVALQAQQGIVS